MNLDRTGDSMRVVCSKEGRIPELKIGENDAFWRLFPKIVAVAEEFDGKGNYGTIFVLLACPCCDRNVFDYNKDIPAGTSVIICPIKEINTEELESRFVVKKMTRALPRTHDTQSLFARIFRGGEPITLDVQEEINFMDDLRAMFVKETDFATAH